MAEKTTKKETKKEKQIRSPYEESLTTEKPIIAARERGTFFLVLFNFRITLA